MQINNYYKFFSLILILISAFSFFIGFIYGENSAGAGTLEGDFKNTWKNLQLFLNNDISTAIQLTATAEDNAYISSRTPLLYILNKLFNPFVENKFFFIKSIFFLSLAGPVLFYLCLKQKFKKEENLLLILVASTICLSPYFRTSAYWGAEENYGLISLLISFIFLSKFLSETNDVLKNYFLLFLTIFFSSTCLYFDQKLAIIPLICFLQIIFSSKDLKLKFSSVFLYLVFSLPYIYLIAIWGNIIPTGDAGFRNIGRQLHFNHLGYTSTIIAFYLLPLLLYKGENLFKLFENFFKNKKNYYFLSLYFIYLIYLLTFHDYNAEIILGKGFIHKIATLIFEQNNFQQIFIYTSFFFSWLIILIYLNNGDLKDKLIIFYFFLISIVVYPILQEYYDPIMILLIFTFCSSKLFINYKNSILLFFYLSILLIFSNIYYYNLLN